MSAKSILLKTTKVLCWTFVVLVAIALIVLTKVDRSPIHDQDFYTETFERLNQATFSNSQGDTWIAGWSRVNMTPAEPADLVGYAPRGKYEFVQDSSYVKALTLSNGKARVAWLNYELLIVHPALAEQIQKAIKEAKLPIEQVIFTATHTHSGMGGYMPGPMGEMAFGGYDQSMVDMMVSRSLSALQKAIAAQDTASISYRKSDAGDLVANRFVKDGPTDPFVRQLIFTKKSGEKATFLTYSAHATTMSTKFMGLSGDYPFYLTKELEAGEFEFAMYAAGTVGSHRPLRPGNTPEMVELYAHKLDSTLNLRMTYLDTVRNYQIRTGHLPISLRAPQLRITDNIRLRPWLFNYLLGETNAHLDITQIGNTLMIASSGEISGVFYEEWEKLSQSKGLNLIITTFNGGYIGYITPDELYDENYHEVRGMNWYGPGNGKYFEELIKKVIEKAGN
ncbi:neutral/alkaline non-lysosomal ceramidase N-terminal domain-containing protein [Algoriphagus sp. D3-2-R+10]|uniref:neutral/alkaline non-lysosomal ceramidase N-terminal domain-containing protein n=1 Tax=Algoriphagus aurantiacus TaxID=3103948 RepID=UPI002B3F034A|nr:neutral/alkaline non-lysosomal ceramidase N-terminal domain-containing protein [Algoriphagus sp. D3-2-R+10]MEB2776117.1 neutral/alkaline non-lysosomal ceramidase N-terminal domain-containing protein [Algoriphagus sp. D3-2-R+10]